MNNIDVLKYIQSKHKETSLKDGKLSYNIYQLDTSKDVMSFDNEELTIQVEIANINQNRGIYTVQMIFIVMHKDFDTELIESVAGVGKTEDSAILDATDKFCMNVLMSIVSTFTCEKKQSVESNFLGEKHIFHKNCLDNVLYGGVENPQHKSLWSLVENIVPEYLGTKKFYWLKLFVSVYNGKSICEARLNNDLSLSLAKPLEEYVKSWSNQKDYHTEKQYILLIQDDSTYRQAPFSKKDIVSYTEQVLPLFENIHSQEDYEAINSKVFKVTNNIDLTRELTTFIPEIYCKLALKFENQVDDKITLIGTDNQPIDIRTSQVRSYGYIEDTIKDHIYSGATSSDRVQSAISCSSMYSAINNALLNGSKLENLHITGFAMFLDNSQKMW